MEIYLDYPYTPRYREWGQRPSIARIVSLLENGRDSYIALLSSFSRFAADFDKIDIRNDPANVEPAWVNGWLPALDSASIYGLLAAGNPQVYLEVGSGNSTKFARRAIRDHHLKTKIISIDPNPRADIDTLCDQVIRLPCEDVDPRVFEGLPSDSIVFIDNSHRSFQSSDVTVFFTEILPILPSGVIWGLHDIFLPWDYPESWLHLYYNEQYLLFSYLLGGGGQDTVYLPGYYVSFEPTLKAHVHDLLSSPRFDQAERHAGCFWMKRT